MTAVAVSAAKFDQISSMVEAQSAGQPGSSSVWKSAYCGGCHQPTCAIKVQVVNGVAVGVMGDTTSPTNKGNLCPRGNALVMNIYNPYRVKAPLKRTNPNKGLNEDPKWVEISWEEAFQTTADRLGAVRKKNPKSLLYQTGFGREGDEDLPFDKVFGTPNSLAKNGSLCAEHFAAVHLTGTTLDRLDLERCNYVVFAGGTRGGGFVISDSTAHFVDAVARGMKVVALDPHCNNAGQMGQGQWVPIRPGTETAFGMAVVNTIINEIGKFDEWWMKVRSNGPYLIPDTKKEILGTRVFMEDYVRDSASKKPLVWDTAKNQAVPFDTSKGETYALTGSYQINGQTVKPIFQVLKEYIAQFTAEWASKITTVPAETIRQIANDLVKEARIGSTITIDGYTFPYRPAAIDIRRAIAGHRLGTEAYKALLTVNVLLGCSDVPGGIGSTSTWLSPRSLTKYLTPDKDGIATPPPGGKSNQALGTAWAFPPDYGLTPYYPQYQGTGQMTWKAVVNPESYRIAYPAEAFLVHAGNPMSDGVNNRYVEQALKKIPFTVSIAYHIDETTQFADIVFAENSSLESTSMYRMFRNEKEGTDATRGLYATLVKRPVVEKLYNTKAANDIYLELAKRIGFLPDLNKEITKSFLKGDNPGLSKDFALVAEKEYTWEQIAEIKLKNDYGPNAGFKDFEASAMKWEKLATIKESYSYFHAPDNTYRLPIYFSRMPLIWAEQEKNLKSVGATIPNQDMENMARHHSALPFWYNPPNFRDDPNYPFYAIMWKDNFTNQNTVDRVGNPWLQDVIDHYTIESKRVVVPVQAAAKLGIKEGDIVWVESEDGGKTQGQVHVSQLIHPECIGIPGNYGKAGLNMNPKAKDGPNFNVLLSPEEKYSDPIQGSIEIAPRVKVYKV
jgi:anaerobic selenocysteine-containing dehydrogenase